MGPIMTISGLPISCVYSPHCTKYIIFPIKISINDHYILDFLVCLWVVLEKIHQRLSSPTYFIWQLWDFVCVLMFDQCVLQIQMAQ